METFYEKTIAVLRESWEHQYEVLRKAGYRPLSWAEFYKGKEQIVEAAKAVDEASRKKGA